MIVWLIGKLNLMSIKISGINHILNDQSKNCNKEFSFLLKKIIVNGSNLKKDLYYQMIFLKTT